MVSTRDPTLRPAGGVASDATFNNLDGTATVPYHKTHHGTGQRYIPWYGDTSEGANTHSACIPPPRTRTDPSPPPSRFNFLDPAGAPTCRLGVRALTVWYGIPAKVTHTVEAIKQQMEQRTHEISAGHACPNPPMPTSVPPNQQPCMLYTRPTIESGLFHRRQLIAPPPSTQ